MGGGKDGRPSRSTLPPANSSTALLGDVLGASGGAGAVDYCQLTHTLDCVLDGGQSVAIGDAVRLQLGQFLAVRRGPQSVGQVSDHSSAAIADCLRDGYEIVGKVTNVDADAEHFRVTVAGRKR